LARRYADYDIFAGAVLANSKSMAETMSYALCEVASLGFGDGVGGVGSFNVNWVIVLRTAIWIFWKVMRMVK
jgi:hypothetical protein